jgi:uncharacterized protein
MAKQWSLPTRSICHKVKKLQTKPRDKGLIRPFPQARLGENDPMTDNAIVKSTMDYVRRELGSDSSGHDWWHIWRVYNTALHINSVENADSLVVELAALLHDIADQKFHNGDEEIGPSTARTWLEKQQIDEQRIAHICEIIHDLSFKGAGTRTDMPTLEGQIVQDADRLDAIGAMGIARAFAYGGSRGREIYNPEIAPEFHQSFGSYKASKSSTINHFDEKLLLLKDRINTPTGKKMAEDRHAFMLAYLKQFHEEWEGKA